MADDLGYGHLGSFGQKHIRTPNLDRMAREGTRFTQVYAGNPVCAPSRSVLMTGLHSGHTSVRVNGGGSSLRPEDVTVAEALKEAGYATGLFGKWGLGDEGSPGVPNRQGFDEFFGTLNQVHAHFYYPWYLFKNQERYRLAGNEGQKRKQYTHDLIADGALGFIRSHKDERFFLYVPFTIPHFELLVPEESLEEYKGKFPEPFQYVDKRRHYADQPAPRATLAAMITRMDRDVGRILDLLKELDLDRDTIVFFTSDNGGYLLGAEFFRSNGPLRAGKGSLYEGGIRVPMIVRWPGRVRAGAVDEFKWAFWDVFPTLAELGGAETPGGLDGISVAPRLLGRPQKEPDRFLYWDRVFAREGGPPRDQAARRGDWKGVRQYPKKSIQLFNLKTDVGEQVDVAEENPEVVRRFAEYFRTAVSPCRTYPVEPPTWGYERTKTGYVK